MQEKSYETVFILTPVLADQQLKDTVDKFVQILRDNGATIINEENWGLRKLAYTIQNKTTGYYVLVEYTAATSVIATLETEFRRDERVIRFLTTSLDKFALEYNANRRAGKYNKVKEEKEVTA